MRTIVFPLKQEYFEDIVFGRKTEEFRRVNDYWTKRLVGKTYDKLVLTWGYPKADDLPKRLVLPWKGFVEKWIIHEHFGLLPVHVFAIDVRH